MYHALANVAHGHHVGDALHVPWIGVAAILIVVAFWRLPVSYGAFALCVVVVALSGSNLDSFERYALSAFPLVIAGATLLRSPARRRHHLRAVRCRHGALRRAGVPRGLRSVALSPSRDRVGDHGDCAVTRCRARGGGRMGSMSSPPGPAPEQQKARLGEPRWPMAIAVVATGLLRAALPHELRNGDAAWLFLVIVVVLLAVLIIGDPGRIDRDRPWLHNLTSVLIGLISLANADAAVRAGGRDHRRVELHPERQGACWPAVPPSGSPTSSPSPCGTGTSTGAARRPAPPARPSGPR